MIPQPVILAQRQADAATEVLRSSIGEAAASLAFLFPGDIPVRVPTIALTSLREVQARLHSHLSERTPSVLLPFRGHARGHLALLLPLESATVLATTLGVAPTIEGALEEVVVETANMLLNTIGGSIGNYLGGAMSFDPPGFFEAPDLIEKIETSVHQDSDLLVARSWFHLPESTIEIQVLLHLDQPSVEALTAAVESVASLR